MGTARFKVVDTAGAATESATSLDMQRFTGDTFVVDYPSHWIYEIDDNMVLFSGQPNTEEYDATVNVQKILDQGNRDILEALNRIFEEQREDIEGVGGTIVGTEEIDTVGFSGFEAYILYYIAEYELGGVPYLQFTAILEGTEPLI